MAKQTFTTGQVLTAAEMTALQANDYNQTVTAKTASYVLLAADAGTRITMSNAGATTITVNTSLFTAGDTLFITNIGAGACTITAGTATVSTASSLVLAQYASGQLYFTSTGVAIFEKYDTAGGGSLTLLQTLSCTTSSTTSAAIVGTYKSIYIEFVGGQLNGEQIQLRFNSDASGLYYTGQAGGVANQAMTATAITLSYQNVGNVATNLMALTIPNYANTTTHKIVQAYGMSYNGTDYMINNLVGAWRSTSAITTVTFKSSVGASITATAYIYGVN